MRLELTRVGLLVELAKHYTTNAYLSEKYSSNYVKCKQPGRGLELKSLCPFSTMISITQRALRCMYVYMYVYMYV